MVGGQRPGIRRRPAVAQEQGTGTAFGLRLGDGLVDADGTARPQADMTVSVDQSRDDPALTTFTAEDRPGSRDRFAAQDAVNNPPFNGLAVGQPAPPHM